MNLSDVLMNSAENNLTDNNPTENNPADNDEDQPTASPTYPYYNKIGLSGLVLPTEEKTAKGIRVILTVNDNHPIYIYRVYRAFNDTRSINNQEWRSPGSISAEWQYIGSFNGQLDKEMNCYAFYDYVNQSGSYYYRGYYYYYRSWGGNFPEYGESHTFDSNTIKIDVDVNYSPLNAPDPHCLVESPTFIDHITIQWENIPNATHYMIYRVSNPNIPEIIDPYCIVNTNEYREWYTGKGLVYYYIRACNRFMNSLRSKVVIVNYNDEDVSVDIANFTCAVNNDNISFSFLDIDQSGICSVNYVIVDSKYIQGAAKISVQGKLWTITIPNNISPEGNHTLSMIIYDKDCDSNDDRCYAYFTFQFQISAELSAQKLNSTIKQFSEKVDCSADEIWTNPNHKISTINKLQELFIMTIAENASYEDVMAKIENDLRKHLDCNNKFEKKKGNGPEWLLDMDFAILCNSYLDKITELCEKTIKEPSTNFNQKSIIKISVILFPDCYSYSNFCRRIYSGEIFG